MHGQSFKEAREKQDASLYLFIAFHAYNAYIAKQYEIKDLLEIKPMFRKSETKLNF